MSFYNDLRMALENDESADVVITDAEQEVVEVEIDAQRDEIERLEEQAEQTEDLIEELDTQNTIIRSAVERGEFTETAAAGFEAARRMAVVALGGDPDSENPAEQGRDLIDSAGLESIVNTGVLSLEANEKEKGKIRQFLEGILEKIAQGWKWLMEKLNKALTWLSNRFNNVHAAINNLSDEEIKEAIDRFIADHKGKDKNPVAYLFMNGLELVQVTKYKDLQKEVIRHGKESTPAVKAIQAAVKSGDAAKITAAIEAAGNGVKFFGKEVFKDYKLNPEFESMLQPSESVSYDELRRISRQELLDVTEVGVVNQVRVMVKDVKLDVALYDLRQAVKNADTETASAELKQAIQFTREYVTFMNKLSFTFNKVGSAWFSLTNYIVKAARSKKEKKEEK